MPATLRTDTKESGEAERLRSPAVSPDTPSHGLIRAASRRVADSFLIHSGVEKRESFHGELLEALEGTEAGERVHLLAGLKEAGLGYKKLRGVVSLSMRSPNLSNPDPDEFSSAVSGAIKRGTALEVLAEKGRETFETPEGAAEMSAWLENMEIAVRSSGDIIPGGASG